MTESNPCCRRHARRTLREITILLDGIFDAFGADPALINRVTECLAETYRDALAPPVRSTRRPAQHPGFGHLMDLLDGLAGPAHTVGVPAPVGGCGRWDDEVA